ncbi:hypothetical protein POVCU2_0096850 [Plasmodium ovale curtisi]|uniref:Uncharacterized protein n=1 Tax=Plasmodium ovale curtisi TaxID=864141 RepID=A0A1A8WUN4_PLAOA|nr:hypothetical protein POVCU2_0096850 [Plasmodium ovale curtisi]
MKNSVDYIILTCLQRGINCVQTKMGKWANGQMGKWGKKKKKAKNVRKKGKTYRTGEKSVEFNKRLSRLGNDCRVNKK